MGNKFPIGTLVLWQYLNSPNILGMVVKVKYVKHLTTPECPLWDVLWCDENELCEYGESTLVEMRKRYEEYESSRKKG